MANGIEKDLPAALSLLQDWALKQGWPIDGVRADEVTSEGTKCLKGEKDFVNQPSEIFDVVFSHLPEYFKTLHDKKDDPFKKLELNWLKPGSAPNDLFQITEEFKNNTQNKLLGEQGLLKQKAQEYAANFKVPIDDPRNAVQLLRYAFNNTEFKLLPLEDQKALLDEYLNLVFTSADHRKELKSAMLGELKHLQVGTNLRKVVAQDAALKGSQLGREAADLRKHARQLERRSRTSEEKGDDEAAKKLHVQAQNKFDQAQRKDKNAGELLEMALGMNPENALAHREMARHLFHQRKPDPKNARLHLIEAIRNEKSEMGQLEIVSLAQQSGDANIPDAWKFFDDKMNLLNRKEELAVIHRNVAAQVEDKDPESQFKHLKAAYEAGNRETQVLEKLAEGYSQHQDFSMALQVGQERYKLGFANLDIQFAYDLKMADYAEKSGDLILANQYITNNPVYFKDSLGFSTPGPNMGLPPAKVEAYIKFYSDPVKFMNKAEALAEKGDYVKAEVYLKWAYTVNNGMVARTTPKDSFHDINHQVSFIDNYKYHHSIDASIKEGKLIPTVVMGPDGIDPGVNGRIKILRGKLETAKGLLSSNLNDEITTQTAKSQTATGQERDEAIARLQQLEKTRGALSLIDYYSKGISDTAEFGKMSADILSLKNAGESGKKFKAPLDSLEASVNAYEAYIHQHPELDTYLKPGLKQLKTDVEILKEDFRTSNSQGMLSHAAQFDEHLKALAGPGIKHNSYVPLLDTKVKIASGLLHNDPALFSQGIQDLQVIQEYVSLEEKKEAAFKAFAAYYPTNTTLVFELDFDPKDPKIKEYQRSNQFSTQASLESVQKNPIRDYYVSLKLANKDPKLMAHLENVLSDLRASSRYGYLEGNDPNTLEVHFKNDNINSPYLAPAFRQGLTQMPESGGGIEALKKTNEQLRITYGGSENGQIIQGIFQRENKKQLEENDGYKTRNETSESMATLQDFGGVQKTFAVLEKNAYQGVSSDQVVGVRDFFLGRGETYKKYLEEEVKRIAAEDDKKLVAQGAQFGSSANAYLGVQYFKEKGAELVDGLNYYNSGKIPEKRPERYWMTEREKAARAKLAAFNDEFDKKKTALTGIEKGDPVEALKILDKETTSFLGYEDAHLQGLLSRQKAMVDAIPGKRNMSQGMIVSSRIATALTKTSIPARLQEYQEIQKAIDGMALEQSIQARIEMFESMGKEVGTTDKIINVVSLGGADADSKIHFTAKKKSYEKALALIKEGKTDEGRKLFLELEQAGDQTSLKETYEDSAFFNQFTLGVGIVIASAMTAGAASGAVAALGGGAILEGATMATVFTFSSKLYHNLAYDGLSWSSVGKTFTQIGKDPLGFGEEVLLNWAMFGMLNKVGKTFSGFFNARVEVAAIRSLATKGVGSATMESLVSKGLVEEGAKITEEMIAKNPALKEALASQLEAETMAIKDRFLTMALEKGGAFAAEALSFQAWDFGMANYRMVKEGKWSGKGVWEAAKKSFSPKEILHGALFLLALKGGGVLTMPLTNIMQAKLSKFAMGRLEKKFQKLQEDIQAADAAAAKYFETGEGNPKEIVRRYKEAALKQKAFIKDLPEGVANPALVVFNEAFLKQVANLEAGLEPWNKIFGLGNEFGLRTNEKGINQFADAKGEGLIKALRLHPWVKGVEVHPNGLVEVTFTDPSNGKESKLNLLSEGDIKKTEMQAMQDAALVKLDQLAAERDAAEAAKPKEPASADKTANIRRPKLADDLPMAAQPGEALSAKPETDASKTPASQTSGNLENLGGGESISVNFGAKSAHFIKVGEVTLLVREVKAPNGKIVYKVAYFGPPGEVVIHHGKGKPREITAAKSGEALPETSQAFLHQGDTLEVNGQKYEFHKPKVSALELEAKRNAEIYQRAEQRAQAEQGAAAPGEGTVAGGPRGRAAKLETDDTQKTSRPMLLDVGGKPIRSGEAVFTGTGEPWVVDTHARVFHNLPEGKGKLLFYLFKNPRTGQIEYSVSLFGESGSVKVQRGGEGKYVDLEAGGKYGEKAPPRHELREGDVLLVNGERVTFHSPEWSAQEGLVRDTIKAERENIAQRRAELSKESDPKIKADKEEALKKQEGDFQKRLETEQRTLEGVPYAEEMPRVSRSVAGAVFDGKVTVDGKEMPLFTPDGKVSPAARKALREQVVADLTVKGMKLSNDGTQPDAKIVNTKAVDSILDLAVTAKKHGIVDQPGGLTRNQFFRLINELYLHKSPSVRIGGAELTHVPMVVEGTLGFLEAQNPNATASDKRVAFVTSLFHDAGKWDPNLRTDKGYTINPHPFFNPTGKAIVVEPGKSFSETLDKYEQEGKLSADERAKIKMPGYLISVIVHHDASAVHETLRQLEAEGILNKGEAERSWQAIEKHGLVSSWILNNSFGGINVLSHSFLNPKYQQYLELYRELTNRMLNGEKIDLSADTYDPKVIRLREIFWNVDKDPSGFNDLDRSMGAGDELGQNDPSKYSGILPKNFANKEASVWQVLLGGDRGNSVNGVFVTHADELKLLMPETGAKAGEDFQISQAWLSQMDPQKPGLAQAIINDPVANKLFEAWKLKNPAKPGTVEAWLKDEKVLGGNGEPSDTLFAVKRAVEVAFYEHFFVEQKESFFQWERPAAQEKPVVELSDADLQKMVVEEEHLLTDKDLIDVRDTKTPPPIPDQAKASSIPLKDSDLLDVRDSKTPPPIPDQAKAQSKNVTPEVMKKRIGEAFKMLRELGMVYDAAYLQQVGRTAATHNLDPAEARKNFKAIDEGLDGVNDFAAHGIARKAIFIEVLEGRMTLEEAQNLGKSILHGEIRIKQAEPRKSDGPSVGYERPFEIEIVVPGEQMSAMRDAHVQRALAATGRDPMNEGMVRLRRALKAALVRGDIDLIDLFRAAGVGLNHAEIKAREAQLGIPRNGWMSELAKNPVKFKNIVHSLADGEIPLDDAALEQMRVKEDETLPADKKNAPEEKGGEVISLTSRRKGKPAAKEKNDVPELAIAAQPMEADTSKAETNPRAFVPDSIWSQSIAEPYPFGIFPMVDGKIEVSRLPKNQTSFNVHVGQRNPLEIFQEPTVVVNEFMGARDSQTYAHFEKTPQGWRVQNQQKDGNLTVVKGMEVLDIPAGQFVELRVGHEVQIGMNNFILDQNGDLVAINPMGLLIGGEIVIP